MNSEACAVFLVLFVSKLAVIELEISARIIQYKRKPFNHLLVILILHLRAEHKYRRHRRVGVDIQEQFELVLTLRHIVLQVRSDKLNFC